MEETFDLRTLFVPPDKIHGDSPISSVCPYHNDSDPSRLVYRYNTYCFGGCSQTRKWENFYECFKRKTGENYDGGNITFVDSYIDDTKLFLNLCDIPEKYRIGTFSSKEVELYSGLLFNTYPTQRTWLHQRGFTDQSLRLEKIGHTGISYTIPVWDFVGDKVLTLRHRRDDLYYPHGSKYWDTHGLANTYLVNAHAIKGGVNAVLCESELCALLLSQYYREGKVDHVGLSLTNGIRTYEPNYLGIYLPLFLLLDRFVIAIDRDSASKDKWLKIASFLYQKGVNVYLTRYDIIKGKDVTEYVVNNGIGEFQRLLDRAVKYV